jgi:hypothetical protein
VHFINEGRNKGFIIRNATAKITTAWCILYNGIGSPEWNNITMDDK